MGHVVTSGDVFVVFGVIIAGVAALGLFALILSIIASGWNH